jgi:hypothetical protein
MPELQTCHSLCLAFSLGLSQVVIVVLMNEPKNEKPLAVHPILILARSMNEPPLTRFDEKPL